MTQNISYKNFFKRYGIFVAILAVIIGILVYAVKISQKSWEKNLMIAVEAVLDEKDPNGWTFENTVEINNPFTMNAACYEVRNRKDGDLYKAFIVRVQTLYGPLPAVFTINKYEEVEFIGYSSLHGVINSQLMSQENNKRIDYWINKIPKILNQNMEEGENE